MLSLKCNICFFVLMITAVEAFIKDHHTSSTTTKNDKPKDSDLIDKLEKSLLQMFGLDQRPKVDKNSVKIPPYMLRLYNEKVKQNMEENNEAYEEEKATNTSSTTKVSLNLDILANTVRSFTHSESKDDAFHPSHKMLFRFNVSSVPLKELLRAAELRIFHRKHSALPENLHTTRREDDHSTQKWSKEDVKYLQRIRVYDVIRPARGSNDEIYRLLDTKIIDARWNDTASFDVGPAIKRWVNKPRSNYGIFVQVIPLKNNLPSLLSNASHVRLRRDTTETMHSEEWQDQQPLLVVHTDDGTVKPREKRSAGVSAHKRPHCRRYKLFVNFRTVEWHTWIVAPHGYDAFFCQGECPYPLAKHMNATNHAVIQNIIHSRYPARVPSACCVPIKHSAISMLYLDRDSKVTLKTYQDMIVESCGCQ